MRKLIQQALSISIVAALLIPVGWITRDTSANAANDSVTNTVVLEQSFEDGQTGGWGKLSWGTNGVASVSSDVASHGTKSLKFSNRADAKAIPALTLTQFVKSGHMYDISLKVRLGSGSADYHIGSKIDSDKLENKYPWIVGNKKVTATDWTTFEAKGYEIADNTKEVMIWVEPAGSDTSDLYIDEVLIKDVTPEQTPPEVVDKTGITADFESGLQGFVARNGQETVVLSTEDNHTPNGKQSLKVTTTTQYDGALVDALGKMAKNHQYELSAWVKMAPGQPDTRLRISVQYGDSSYANVSSDVTVKSGEWVQLTGKYTLATTPTVMNAYVETADNDNGNRTFFLDDFKLTYLGPVDGSLPVQEDLPSIKDVYAQDFLIGNAVSSVNFEGDYSTLLNKHHNVVTAENAMKPDGAYNANKQFDFTAQDALVAKMEAAGLKIHGHVLVWHQQTPAWLSTAADGKPLSREEALTNLRTHIKTVMEHFQDKVISWDVVNEAMNDNPPNPVDWKASLRQAPWKSAIGDDYVEQAFLAAREVLNDPKNAAWASDIKLYYNDYNDDNQNKSQAIANMIKELNEKYAKDHPGQLLIDGMGMQAHYNLNTNPANVLRSLERFISLGIEVSITELDIMAGQNSQLTEEEANKQGYLYAQLMKMYKEHADHIARVTFWGLSDGLSWRAENSPLVFDKQLQAKPAYYGIIDPDNFLEDYQPGTPEEMNKSTANYGTPVIDGTIDAIWSQAAALPLNRYQTAWQGASGVAKALWDDQNLYVLIQVNDAQLDKSSANVWEQDSVEIFLDENNEKTTFYQDDDGQFRVNFDNETSFNPDIIAEGFVSATKVSGTNYTVEVKIPFKKITPANDKKIGFDAQINDAKNGARQSVAAWNDQTGNGYQDTSVFGELTLTGKPGSEPDPEPVEPSKGVIIPKVEISGDAATAKVSKETLIKGLESAPKITGKKQVTIEVTKKANAKSYEVQLPTQPLKGNGNFVILLETEYATVEIPSSKLSHLAGKAGEVSIHIAKASADKFDKASREAIGTRPVIDLSVTADGKAIANDNAKEPITVSIPYTPTATELNHLNSIMMIGKNEKGSVSTLPNSRYDAKTGMVTIKTNHFSTYAVAYVSKSKK